MVVQGQSYTSAYKGGYGYNYTNDPTEKKFYGYYSADNVSAPICIMDSYGNPQYYIEDSAIAGGGTPIVSTGNFVAYQKDANRTGGTVNVPNGWFESIYLDWNSWGTGGGGIAQYEIWYRESSDGKTWSGRVKARSNIITTNNYGNCTLGSVNQTSSASNWGTRGKYYQFCIVGISKNGYWSNTEFWSSTYRKSNVSTYSFSANGGSGAPATQYKFTGYNFVFPSTKPKRTGYTFAGWMRSGNSTKYSANQNVSGLPDSAVTWNAQWTVNSYKLTVNPNGGTWNSSTSSQSFTQNYGTTKAIPNPTRSGYRFNGWTKSGSGSLSGTTFTFGAGATTLTATWVAIYYLNLNVFVNGTSVSSTTAAVADVYINGSKVASAVSDYYKQHDTGTKYEIKNIVVGNGYTQYSSSNLSGTLTAKTDANIFVGQNYTNTIYHWLGGFENQEGNSTDKTYYRLNKTTFSTYYSSSYIMDTSKGVAIPNGCELSTWASSDIAGTWTIYDLGTSVTQKAKNMSYEYRYYPLNYNITYDLNGGINNVNNPSAYNVLYGINLLNPKKNNSVFVEWHAETDNNTITMTANDNNYKWIDIIPGFRVQPNITYTINIDSATLTSGSATQFSTVIYDFTSNFSVLRVNRSFGDNQSYTITCPSTADASHKLCLIIYAGVAGGTSGNTTTYTNAKVSWVLSDINGGQNATFSSVDDLYSKLDSRIACNLTLTAQWRGLTPEERKIFIYKDGVCEAIEFNENDDFVGFQSGGKVNAKQFIENSNVQIMKSGVMYFSEIREKFS